MKLKKADLILIVAVLCAAFVGLGYWILTRQEGACVVIRQGKGDAAKVVAELPLDEDAELLIDDGKGGTNRLVIQDGVAYVTEANCPDRICVESYRKGVSYDGETIVCLPHELIVAIEGGEQPDVDPRVQ